jgi:pimeloyl-ACP methyl ester carboxylesterase
LIDKRVTRREPPLEPLSLPCKLSAIVSTVNIPIGEGPCVILLHAGVADRRMWRTTADALSPRFRVIAYDRRGFGQTTTADEAFRHIDDLDAVLYHFDCPTAHLIGCSQGGRIAIDYALAHPEKVGSLVLVASAITGAPQPESHPAEIAQLLKKLEDAEHAGNMDEVNALEAHLWLDGPLSTEGRVSGPARSLFLDMNGIALRHPPLTQEESCPSAFACLEDIVQPTLAICGDRDFPHLQERAQHLASRIPRAQSLIMPGCAHLPNLEQPDMFNNAVANFLRETV